MWGVVVEVEWGRKSWRTRAWSSTDFLWPRTHTNPDQPWPAQNEVELPWMQANLSCFSAKGNGIDLPLCFGSSFHRDRSGWVC